MRPLDAAAVLGAAEVDADHFVCGGRGGARDYEGYAEVELADGFELELAGLELDDDLADSRTNE